MPQSLEPLANNAHTREASQAPSGSDLGVVEYSTTTFLQGCVVDMRS